ncbi:MAG: Tad domain-containing protein [Elusimicrobia bacterium]|nr:Tad domain-containing protein [Elusimicrobiota bacterium]
MKKESGQAIVLVALTVLVMCLFTFMVINTGVVFYRRIQMQNAADCAALSSTRITARSLNTIASMNNGIGVPEVFIPIIIKGNCDMNIDLKSAYETMRNLATGWNRASAAQASFVGSEVAKLNGADTVKRTYSLALKLSGKKIRVWWYKLVTLPIVGTIPVPWSPFKTSYNPAYYRRSWATKDKKAQPTHKVKFRVYKKAYQPFAGSLFGNLSSARETRASAQAKVFYDCKKSYALHYGGFPRSRNASLMEKTFIPQPVSVANPAQFNAYLIPYGLTYFH